MSRFFDRRPPSDAVAVVSFDRGDASDRSHVRSVPTLVGSPTFANGVMTLDGTSACVTYPDTSELDLGTAFTVSIWIEPSSPGSAVRSIAAKYQTSAGNNRSYALYADYAGGYWQAIVTRDGTLTNPYLNYRWATSLPTSGWKHIAWVVDTNAVGSSVRMKLYQDATLLTPTTVFSDSSGFTPQNNAKVLVLGAIESGASGFFKGNMDSFQIFRRALSVTEIQRIITQGRA